MWMPCAPLTRQPFLTATSQSWPSVRFKLVGHPAGESIEFARFSPLISFPPTLTHPPPILDLVEKFSPYPSRQCYILTNLL